MPRPASIRGLQDAIDGRDNGGNTNRRRDAADNVRPQHDKKSA